MMPRVITHTLSVKVQGNMFRLNRYHIYKSSNVICEKQDGSRIIIEIKLRLFVRVTGHDRAQRFTFVDRNIKSVGSQSILFYYTAGTSCNVRSTCDWESQFSSEIFRWGCFTPRGNRFDPICICLYAFAVRILR